MNLLLQRDSDDGMRTFGILYVGNYSPATLVLQTLERPWIDGPLGGQPGVSCIPLGTYQLVLHDTVKHPKTWAMVNQDLGVYHEPEDIPAGEPGRSACLIHSANLVHQLEGCIGVGLERSQLNGEPDIASSVAAFTQLKAAVPWISGHILEIT